MSTSVALLGLDARGWVSVGGTLLVAALLGLALLRGWPRRIPTALRMPLQAFFAAVAVLCVAHAIFVVVARAQPGLYYTVNDSWPLRIFAPRIALAAWPDALFLPLGAGVVALAVRSARSDVPLSGGRILGLSLLLLLTLNASQGGIEEGLAGSVSNPPILDQMYDDAIGLPPVGELLRTYADPETIRHWRSPHTKSHPPLPLLVLAACRSIGMSPFAVGLLLLAAAAVAPCLALRLYRKLSPRSPIAAGRLALLLALSPAVNVYGGTSMEGPFLTLALATAVVFVPARDASTRLRAFLGGLSCTLLCLYSFGGIWMIGALPCLSFLALPRGDRLAPARLLDGLLFLAPMIAVYLGLRGLWEYDYVAHVRHVAAAGMGVNWLSGAVLALETRLQNVGELVLLGTPLLLGAWMHVASRLRRSPSSWPAGAAAPGAALALLLAFTPIYSEFARGWILLAPVLLVPCISWMRRRETALPVLAATGASTVLWQCFGYFGW